MEMAFSRVKFILSIMKIHQWVQTLFNNVKTYKHHDNIKYRKQAKNSNGCLPA
jgi:hypothetical protein